MESALQKSQLEAINANKSKSDFLLKMSHELLTSLNAVIGFSAFHKDDNNLTDEQSYSIKIIHKAGNYLHSIINDILDRYSYYLNISFYSKQNMMRAFEITCKTLNINLNIK